MANERARELRKSMSDAERKLWHALRAKQVDGARFRRQHPIGPYIVDFVCLERRLVVEVDGGQHTDDAHIADDARRDQWLMAEGYRVLRLPTTEVYANIAGVLDTIWSVLQGHPTSNAIELSSPVAFAARAVAAI
jgi:very-short-patch-repair endonuclease